jgi:hypothetical protein
MRWGGLAIFDDPVAKAAGVSIKRSVVEYKGPLREVRNAT